MKEYYRPDYTPEWFHLENYEPLKDMSREALYAILRERSTIFHFREFKALRWDRGIDEWFNRSPNLTLAEMNEMSTRYSSIIDVDVVDVMNADGPDDTLISLGCHHAGFKVIAVDISDNDNKIIEDMREWLEQKRKGSKERLTDSKKDRLIENKIIPCMDLLFWSEHKGISYTDAQLGDMLYPFEDFNRAEKVRKKTRPEAIKYLTTSAYTTLL